MKWDTRVEETEVDVTVERGIVTLTGTLAGWVTLEGDVSLCRELEDLERVVRRLAGVRGLNNKIEVKPVKIKAEDVREAIEEALERRAEREARHIKVEVDDGEVKLSGPVRSWAEKRAILGIVSHAPGVRAVDERLFVDLMF